MASSGSANRTTWLHPDRADLVVEVPEYAAGFDGGELLIVAHQTHDSAGGSGALDKSVEHQRAGHTGFVDQDQRARGDGVLVVVELGQRVRRNAELLAEDVGGGS